MAGARFMGIRQLISVIFHCLKHLLYPPLMVKYLLMNASDTNMSLASLSEHEDLSQDNSYIVPFNVPCYSYLASLMEVRWILIELPFLQVHLAPIMSLMNTKILDNMAHIHYHLIYHVAIILQVWWNVVCSTSLMASLNRSVGGLLKCFYQALWLVDLNTEVIGQFIKSRRVA